MRIMVEKVSIIYPKKQWKRVRIKNLTMSAALNHHMARWTASGSNIRVCDFTADRPILQLTMAKVVEQRVRKINLRQSDFHARIAAQN
jgi:hypothetical protein